MGVVDLRDFVVQADRDGELSLDHLVDGCWESLPFETDDGMSWPTVQQLNEAAQRHMKKRHVVVIESDAWPTRL